MLTLYYAPRTIAVATAITLHEASVPFELVQLDFAGAEQTRPEYLATNPKGRVPTLVTEHGNLTETGALLEYINAISPQAGLVPTDPFRAAKMREVMYYLASTMHVNHAHKMRGSRWAKQQGSFDDMAAMVPENMTACATHIQDHALTGPFVVGETISLADPYLFVICTWLAGDGVDMAAFPKITDFMAIMENRPSVQAVRQQGLL